MGTKSQANGGAHLDIRGVSKRFGAVHAVRDGNLTVARGEVVALLGPSGCGKSTLLNMIAGFEVPDTGDICLNGTRLNETPPNRRPTAMVFQHYALFPHMSVQANVSYGLRVRRAAAATIAARTRECLELLKLGGLEQRYPSELSGGQRQRVAVARALAVQPEVLLLDEALSALDKNLREEMQVELLLLLRRLAITTILVTHDQREAFALGDRIAVIEDGRVVQVGAPQEVYRRPKSQFVLGFLGHVNRLAVDVRPIDNERAEVRSDAGLSFECPRERIWTVATNGLLCIRSEDLTLSAAATDVHVATPGLLRLVSFLGSTLRYVVELGGEEIVLERATGEAAAHERLAPGDRVYLQFQPDRCFVIDAGT